MLRRVKILLALLSVTEGECRRWIGQWPLEGGALKQFSFNQTANYTHTHDKSVIMTKHCVIFSSFLMSFSQAKKTNLSHLSHYFNTGNEKFVGSPLPSDWLVVELSCEFSDCARWGWGVGRGACVIN